MSGRESAFEDFRRREGNSGQKTAAQLMVEERARLEAVAGASRYIPSRGGSASPLKYSRNVQSADNTILEDGLSPTSMGNAVSPRFVEGESALGRHPFVSDYVAFGRGKESFTASKERVSVGKRTDAASFSLYSDQSSYVQFDDMTAKANRMEQHLAKKNEVIAQMAKENAALTRELQDCQSRLSALENYKTETALQLQDAQRESKSADTKYRQLLKDFEELRQKQYAKDEQYRKLDRQYSNLSLLQGRLEEAENGKIALVRDIGELQKEVSAKRKETEELIAQVAAQRDSLAERSEECHNLKKERLRLLKDLDESKRREAALERELRTETAERDRLKGHIQQLEDTARSVEDRRDTEETIEVLKRENDALVSELRAKGKPQEMEKRIKELEAALREEQRHVRYLTLMKEDSAAHLPRHRNSSHHRKRRPSCGSRTRAEESAESRSKSPSFATQKRVLRELMDAVGVTGSGELLASVKALVRKGKSLEAVSEFIEKINGIVVQYSPPGTFVQAPSLKQVWKWVSRLIDEYMALRKTHDSHALLSDLVSELCAALSVSHYSDLPAAVDRVLTENSELRGRRSRLRADE